MNSGGSHKSFSRKGRKGSVASAALVRERQTQIRGSLSALGVRDLALIDDVGWKEAASWRVKTVMRARRRRSSSARGCIRVLSSETCCSSSMAVRRKLYVVRVTVQTPTIEGRDLQIQIRAIPAL